MTVEEAKQWHKYMVNFIVTLCTKCRANANTVVGEKYFKPGSILPETKEARYVSNGRHTIVV